MKKTSLILLLFIVTAQTAGAWGSFGHRTIVEMAKNHLTESAKSKIEAAMGGDIALEASFMDRHRKEDLYRYAYNFHNFALLPGTTTLSGELGFDTGGNAVIGLAMIETYLKHFDTLSPEHQKTVIRMAIHFFADIHCPAHAFFEDHVQRWKLDLGDGEKPRNFHGFYDHFPEKYLFAGKTEKEAAALLDNCRKGQIRKFSKGTSEDWLRECAEYDLKILEINPMPQDTFSTIQAAPQTVELSIPIVERQMKAAACRVAAILNKYL